MSDQDRRRIFAFLSFILFFCMLTFLVVTRARGDVRESKVTGSQLFSVTNYDSWYVSVVDCSRDTTTNDTDFKVTLWRTPNHHLGAGVTIFSLSLPELSRLLPVLIRAKAINDSLRMQNVRRGGVQMERSHSPGPTRFERYK